MFIGSGKFLGTGKSTGGILDLRLTGSTGNTVFNPIFSVVETSGDTRYLGPTAFQRTVNSPILVPFNAGSYVVKVLTTGTNYSTNIGASYPNTGHKIDLHYGFLSASAYGSQFTDFTSELLISLSQTTPDSVTDLGDNKYRQNYNYTAGNCTYSVTGTRAGDDGTAVLPLTFPTTMLEGFKVTAQDQGGQFEEPFTNLPTTRGWFAYFNTVGAAINFDMVGDVTIRFSEGRI